MKNLLKSVDHTIVCIEHDFINNLVNILKHNAAIGNYLYKVHYNDLYSSIMTTTFIRNTVSKFCAAYNFKYIKNESNKELIISWAHSKEFLAGELKEIADMYNMQNDAFTTTLNTLMYIHSYCMTVGVKIKFDNIYSAYIIDKLCSEYSHIFKLSNTDTGHIYIKFIR